VPKRPIFSQEQRSAAQVPSARQNSTLASAKNYESRSFAAPQTSEGSGKVTFSSPQKLPFENQTRPQGPQPMKITPRGFRRENDDNLPKKVVNLKG
jgi:hypothetical protein